MSPQDIVSLGQFGLGVGLLWLVAKWAPLYAQELVRIRVQITVMNGGIQQILRRQDEMMEVLRDGKAKRGA